MMRTQGVGRRYSIFVMMLLFVIGLSGCQIVGTVSIEEQEDMERVVRSFIQAINDQDSNQVEFLLSQKIKYTEKYADSSKFTSKKPEDIDQIIQEVIDNHTKMTIEKLQIKNNKTIEIEGMVTDYIIETLGFSKGIRFYSKYTMKHGKIIEIEFERSKEDEKILNEKQEGIVGFYLNMGEDQIIIDQCDTGLPADKAGLKQGDVIEAVDGIAISEMKYGKEEAIYRIRGPVNTKVKLTINRGGTIFTVELQRTK